MEVTCIKCGHVNPAATGDELDTCPRCGVIYSKARITAARPAEAVGATLPPVTEPRTPQPRSLPQRSASRMSGGYLALLRAESNYPTFRSVVGLFAGIGYLIAAGLIVSVVVSVYKGEEMSAGALVLALLIAIIVRVGKEVSLMVADGSDALVRMAERQEQS